MASVLECENENPASDEERHTAIERLRPLCNLVHYNLVKIWPLKDPLSNVEIETASNGTEYEEPFAMRGGNNSSSKEDESKNLNTKEKVDAKKTRKKTRKSSKTKVSGNTPNNNAAGISNPYTKAQTHNKPTHPNQHKMKQTAIHSFTKLDNGSIKLPTQDKWPIRGQTEAYPNLFPSVRLSSLLKHSYATKEPKVKWTTLQKLEDNDKVRLLLAIIHDIAK